MTHLSMFLRRALRPMALVVAVAALLAASGCGDDNRRAAAATVDGHEIEVAPLEQVLAAIAKSDPTFKGDGKKTYPADGTASVLTFLIQHELLIEAAHARGVNPTAAQKEQGRTNVLTILGQSDQVKGRKLYKALNRATRLRLVQGEAALLALQKVFSKGIDQQAEAQAEYKAHPEKYTNACLSAIVTNDKASADKVQARLAAGEDFKKVSRAASIDQSLVDKDGDLGCNPMSTIADAKLSAAIAKAKPNEVLDTIEGNAQFIVVQVRELKLQAFKAVSKQIISQLPVAGGDKMQAYLNKRAKTRDITVDPRYGHWNPKTSRVVPPKQPKGLATTTTSGPSVSVPAAGDQGTTTKPGN